VTWLATRENTEADLIKPRRLAWTVDWGDPSTLRTGVALPQVQRPEQVLFPYQGMNFSTLNGFGGYGNLRLSPASSARKPLTTPSFRH